MKRNKKIAVVIGATGKLGSVIHEHLRQAGYSVDEQWANIKHPDVREPNSFERLPEKIDLAVYAAGYNLIKNTENLTTEDWDNVLDINLKGGFLFAAKCFERMQGVNGALIVFISSINSLHPYPKRLPYSVSKAGLEAMVRSLAIEWGQYGIFTHGIRLGHLDTTMQGLNLTETFLRKIKEKSPTGQLVETSAVASYIEWLHAKGAPSLTGSVIDFEPAYTINRDPTR